MVKTPAGEGCVEGGRMLNDRATWKALEQHHMEIQDKHLRSMFAGDPNRAAEFSIDALGIYLDFSKNRITRETLRMLIALANECGLKERIEAMFRGDKINVTENRAVLHVALRAPRDAVFVWDGKN